MNYYGLFWVMVVTFVLFFGVLFFLQSVNYSKSREKAQQLLDSAEDE